MYGRSTAAPHVRTITTHPALASWHPCLHRLRRRQPPQFLPSHIETALHLP